MYLCTGMSALFFLCNLYPSLNYGDGYLWKVVLKLCCLVAVN
jgi:hypothetical protein